MKSSRIALSLLAASLIAASAQARDTVPVERLARGAGTVLSTTVLNTLSKRSIDVAQVNGRGAPAAGVGTVRSPRTFAMKKVSDVMGRS